MSIHFQHFQMNMLKWFKMKSWNQIYLHSPVELQRWVWWLEFVFGIEYLTDIIKTFPFKHRWRVRSLKMHRLPCLKRIWLKGIWSHLAYKQWSRQVCKCVRLFLSILPQVFLLCRLFFKIRVTPELMAFNYLDVLFPIGVCGRQTKIWTSNIRTSTLASHLSRKLMHLWI